MKLAIGLGLAAVLAASATPGAEGEGGRAAVPPGVSQDGSRPIEGAIKGGSIESRKGPDSALERREEIERCRDLEGTLREQCVADAEDKRLAPPAPR